METTRRVTVQAFKRTCKLLCYWGIYIGVTTGCMSPVPTDNQQLVGGAELASLSFNRLQAQSHLELSSRGREIHLVFKLALSQQLHLVICSQIHEFHAWFRHWRSRQPSPQRCLFAVRRRMAQKQFELKTDSRCSTELWFIMRSFLKGPPQIEFCVELPLLGCGLFSQASCV